ncbi:hypothetical protein AVEN_154847-1 [Araneus ventricosus]|uniref:Integrase catalytic domain-containing protein n=1 Tax=Araneus ventricosus TaxID=182803 RepID=A0A4Y2BTC9_ARAVE|nr:hypothetical protein AVEN_154847-1 [Araneus ventricosus]
MEISLMKKFPMHAKRFFVLCKLNVLQLKKIKKSLINLEVYKDDEAPWWGGFWGRLIGMLKDLLRKSLGHSPLTYEELQTLVCECDAVMNNRPLTSVSEEPELKTLTPSMFLQDLRVNDVPDLDRIEKQILLKDGGIFKE